MSDIYLLGVDTGTTSVKVGIFNTKGELRGFASTSYQLEHPQVGWVEISPLKWWRGFLESFEIATRRAKISKDEIVSIGLSTLCPALVAMNPEGEALRPAIIYLDRRSIPQADRLLTRIGLNNIFEMTGNRISPGTISITSMLWIRENEPEIYERARYFGHGNSFLAHRLTGKFVMDYTNASFTGLFGIKEGVWLDSLWGEIDIPREKLPSVISSTSVIGKITKRASEETGLRIGVPVTIGGADTACSALGVGIVEHGQIFLSSGATEVLTICSKFPEFDIRFLNRYHVLPERFLLHGAMSTSGSAIDWFKRQFYPEGMTDDETHEKLFLEARSARPGAKGLLFLPYLMGERTPFWDPDLRGAFLGLSLDIKRADLSRAVLEGIGYGLRQIIEIAEAHLGEEISLIRAVGGGTKNRLWNQIKADITGKPIEVVKFSETAVLGAAILGGIGAGIFQDHYEAGANLADIPSELVEPDSSLYSLYTRYYEIYRELYPILKDKYHRLSKVNLNQFKSLEERGDNFS
jgi:xylulokinase